MSSTHCRSGTDTRGTPLGGGYRARSAPTLAISAADDLFGTYETARYSADHIPGARFIGYPAGGHLWVGHHDEVVAAIAAFVKR